MFASVIAGFLADTLGRKNSLVVVNITAMTSSVLMSVESFVLGIEFTFLAHLITGLSLGFILSIVPLYMGEIAPRNHRGALIFLHQFFLNIGILMAQILSVKELLEHSEGWSILMGMVGLLTLVQLFLLPFIPESPRYLMIYKRNEPQARKVLKMLRETDDVDNEIEEMSQEDLAEGNNKDMTPLKLIRTPSMRWHIITIVVIMAGSQLNGISVAYFYTERIFLIMPMKRSDVKYLTTATIVILCSSVLLVMYLVDNVGRRILLLTSFTCCSISSILLIVSLELQKTVSNLSYFSSTMIILFVCAHDFGPAALPHLLTLELFSQSSRASAFVISGSVFWSANFITGLTFFYLEKDLGYYCFVVFWPFCIGTIVYIYKMVPETKTQTFSEIKKVMLMKTTKRFRSRESRRKLKLKRHV
ncbi:solute carrier family 2, facilitated glucose transporter member 5-like [Crotalus tigris]|uniref:solute carrier family 2, facilitated glucose transporter member 5-like n=1 Tax=Crotalus tigris TaxID=88082 RepID=UPI00192FB41B|nr:solute carrier family 2, facilitated glucose transporter member 5-like [Crotalus tigris]